MKAAGQAVRRVLHVVPPNGGGVDRFVRDLCRLRPQDWIVHAADAQCVLEWPAGGRFTPLTPSALADLARGGQLGRPHLVHAHSAAAAVRQTCAALCAAAGVPYMLTLHDIGFADAQLPPEEREQRLRFARAAAARTAPSHYIVDLAQQALGAGQPCASVAWVENGVDPILLPASPPTCAAAAALPHSPGLPDGPCAVAVIGAIGEHKGLDALLEVAARLPAGLRVVILGYTANQLLPGWVLPGRVWLHGAFEVNDLPALVASYGARLAFFPPGMPESYCYALSDAWQAGLPALAPAHGALAERIGRLGGGALYDPALPPDALAARLADAAASGLPAPRAQGLGTVQQMVDAMNTLYEQVSAGLDEVPADEAALRMLVRQQLDTPFFRKELLNLQGRLAEQQQVQAQQAERIQALGAALAEQTQQAEALRTHAAGLQTELSALQARLQTSEAAHQALALAHESLQGQQAATQLQYQVLQQRHATLTARLARPLAWLPARWREGAIRLGRKWLI